MFMNERSWFLLCNLKMKRKEKWKCTYCCANGKYSLNCYLWITVAFVFDIIFYFFFLFLVVFVIISNAV